MKNEPTFADTYNRLFGQLSEHDQVGRNITPKQPKQVLTEQQSTTWARIHRNFTNQNPNHTLSLSEGSIKLNGHIVESADKFLARDVPSMVEVLRNAARKYKGQ